MWWLGDRQSKLLIVSILPQVIGTGKRTLSGSIHRREVDIASLHGRHVASSNIDCQIRQHCVTRERHAADGLVVHGAGNLRVVCIDNSRVSEHESGSGVSDGLATSNCHRGARADGELGGAELPEAVGGVDRRPLHGAVELGAVDGAEGVRSSSGLAQISGEHGQGQRRHDVVEESLLLRGLDSIELAKGEADETVRVGVLHEGRGDSRGELNSLLGDGCATDVDNVGADVACSSGSVSVGDGERGALHQGE